MPAANSRFDGRTDGEVLSGRTIIVGSLDGLADETADGEVIELRGAGDELVDARTVPWRPGEGRLTVRARTSVAAALALIVGLSGLYAALSGRLAPFGAALSVFGLVLAIAGRRATRPVAAYPAQPDEPDAGRVVGGSGLATLALVISAAGVILAILALTQSVSWLNGNLDQVSRLRAWIDTKLPWLTRW